MKSCAVKIKCQTENTHYYIDVYNSVNYGFNSQDGVNGKSND